MQGFCLRHLTQSTVAGRQGSGDGVESAPFLPGGGTTSPISNTGGCFV